MNRDYPGPGDFPIPEDDPLWECQSCGHEQETPGCCEECGERVERIQ